MDTLPTRLPVTLSPSAAARVKALAQMEGDPALMLRLKVEGGGCSGFSYKFDLARAPEADDIVTERDGATLLVDDVSLDLVAGAEVDYVEDLMGSYFQVTNPNATASCGCGTSFAVG